MLHVEQPRWGRSYESFSEDPVVITRNGQSYIEGLQYGPGLARVTGAE